jgi:acyl-coenzyme A synthetase/AMP-(fatty) acid ligase
VDDLRKVVPVTEYRLVDRPDHAVLFHHGAAAITTPIFLRHCHALAAKLPPGGHMINLCRDRYAFVLAFAAAVLRRQTCLLTGDRSETGLLTIAETFKDSYIAADATDPVVGSVEAGPDGPPLAAAGLRVCVVAPDALAAETDAMVPDNPRIAASQLAAIVFTSGSTGVPTPHRKTWGALAERSNAAAEQFGLRATAPCAVVGMVPPQHMYGFETTVLLPLHAPTSSWCGPAFFPTDVHAALTAVPEPRILVTTPLQMRGLLRAETKLPALHAAISATAPLDVDLAALAEARWQTRVLEIFGATEVGSIAGRRTIEGDHWTLYPGVRLIAHGDHGGGTSGSGATNDGSAASDAAEGVAVTAPFAPLVPLADEVQRLSHDRFRLLGRRTDIVKLGGHRASLSGLNRALAAVDGVIDGTFVVPDDLDRQPTARLLAIVVAPDRSADSILQELRGRVDPLFLPRRVIRVAALPRNALGKLPREALLSLVAQDLRSTASET